MADNHNVLSRAKLDNDLADDDPLAELARFAGLDRSERFAKTVQPIRQEPEFDLEDELLREFERYDAPKLAPSEIRSHQPAVTSSRTEPYFAPEPLPVLAEPPATIMRPTTFELPDDLGIALEPVSPPMRAETVDEFVEADIDPDKDIAPYAAADDDAFADYVAIPADDDVFAGLDLDRDEPALVAPEMVAAASVEDEYIEPRTAPAIAPTLPLDDELLQALDPFAAYPSAERRDEVDDYLAGSVAFQPEPQLPQEPQDVFPAVGSANLDFAPVPATMDDFATQADIEAEEPFDPEKAFAATVASMRSDSDLPAFDDVGSWDDLLIDTPASVAPIQKVDAPEIVAQITEIEPDEVEEWLPEAEPAYAQAADDWTPEQDFVPVAADIPFDLDPPSPEPVSAELPIAVPVIAEPVVAEPVVTQPEVTETAPRRDTYVTQSDAVRNWQFSRSTPQAADAAAITSTMGKVLTVDDLLAEVERFPVPPTEPDWMRLEPSRAAEKMRIDDIADDFVEPIADIRPSQPAFETPAPVVPAPAAPMDAVTLDPMDLSIDSDPFDDSDFELDLGAIELDLADLDVAPVAKVAPIVVATPVIASPAFAQMAELDVEDRWTQPSAQVGRQANFAVDDTSGLPFDPAQIGETDDVVEQVADLDVPELPVDHDDEPVAAQDFDIDIDTEMARMYPPQVTGSVAKSSAADRQVSSNAGPGSYSSNDAVDEFERALEEDFRRSMAPEIAGSGTPDKMPLLPGLDQIVDEGQGNNRLPLIAGLAVAATLILGAVGGYAYYFNGSSVSADSGKPRIILADKSPIKVVPEDKGGQTVPNQDKAVYDKVAGAQAEVPKQENLVSSTEEPVDVVQKTLVPDSIMDPDNVSGTPTEDTTDPRLLPDDGDGDQANANNPVPGVKARKVRTMIVKPDGTLVAREDSDVTTAPAIIAPKVETAKTGENVPDRLTGDNAKTTETAAAEDVAANDAKASAPAEVALPDEVATETAVKAEPDATKTAETVDDTVTKPDAKDKKVPDAKTADVNGTAAADDNAAALQAAADTEVVENPPVRVVKTEKISSKTPVPASRPSDQEVNVVSTVTDQGNVLANNDQAAVKQVEQASAEPVQQTQVAAGTYVIQIASLPSQAEAQRSYDKLSGKFSNVIGGRGVDIRKAEISGKGTYYRVRIPAGSKDEAVKLCEQYRNAGGSCLVSK